MSQQQTSTQPRRSIWGGTALIVLGRLMILCTLVATFFVFFRGSSLAGLAVIAGAGVWLVKIGTRLSMRDPFYALAIDPRPPVLFLRPFDEDGVPREAHGLDSEDRFSYAVESFATRGVLLVRKLVRGYVGAVDLTLEEEWARSLRKIGPVVAVGKPGEGIQTGGAMRVYLDDAVWQQEVESLMRKAAVVVWQAGTSAGTWWELQAIVRCVPPEKLILLVPNPGRHAKQYEALAERVRDVLPQGLPDWWEPIDFVTFDGHWVPQGRPYRYRPGLLRLFSASTLDLDTSLKALKAGADAAGGGRAELWARWRTAYPANVLVGAVLPPLLIAGALIGRSAIEDHRRAERERANKCDRVRQVLNENGDVSVLLRRWTYSVREARDVVMAPDGLTCQTELGTVSRDLFESSVRRQAAKHFPEWVRLFTARKVSASDVTEALKAANDEALLKDWHMRRDALEAQLARNAVVVQWVPGKEAPDLMRQLLNQRVTEVLESSIVSVLQEALPSPLAPVLASRASSNDLAASSRQITIRTEVLYQSYGESKSLDRQERLLLPGILALDLAFEGCTAGPARQAVHHSETVDLPEEVSISRQMELQAQFAQKLVSQSEVALSRAVARCYR